MRRFSIILCMMLMLPLFSYCGNSALEDREEPAPEAQAEAPSAKKGEVLRLKSHGCVDKQGMGREAFRFLMPADWVFEGDIYWVLDNPGMPARARGRIFNPEGLEEFEIFPDQPFFWTNNQMLLGSFPPGSRYFGNEVLNPASAVEALKNIIVPRFRNEVSDLKIVSEQPLPDLAEALGANTRSQPGVEVRAEGAKMRLEYSRGGRIIEEEIYGVVESMAFSMQTMYGPVININWVVNHLFSFKAEKGGLEKNANLFQTIAHSFQVDRVWFAKYSRLVEYLIQSQIKQIQNIGQLSRYLSQVSNEISEMSMQAYNQRQEVNDRIAGNFSRYIRGVDEYYNPMESSPVELPTGFSNAWANNLGEYVLSNDPGFNPNVGSNLDWQSIKKTE